MELLHRRDSVIRTSYVKVRVQGAHKNRKGSERNSYEQVTKL